MQNGKIPFRHICRASAERKTVYIITGLHIFAFSMKLFPENSQKYFSCRKAKYYHSIIFRKFLELSITECKHSMTCELVIIGKYIYIYSNTNAKELWYEPSGAKIYHVLKQIIENYFLSDYTYIYWRNTICIIRNREETQSIHERTIYLYFFFMEHQTWQ